MNKFYSVSVSAKENDGGVHAAMQSLLRYLLKKKCGDSIPKSKEERKNAFNSKIAQSYAKTLGTVEDHTFVPLEKINIKEVLEFYLFPLSMCLDKTVAYWYWFIRLSFKD